MQRQRRDGHLHLELSVTADLDCFEGHFPRHPVLPGVVQLAWAVHFAREEFAAEPVFQRLVGIKFQRVIMPGQRLTLDLDWHAGPRELVFRYGASDGAFSSGRLRYADV